MTINVITALNYLSNILCDLLQCLCIFQSLLQLKIQDRSIFYHIYCSRHSILLGMPAVFYFSEQAYGCYEFSGFCNSIEKTMKIVCRDDFRSKRQ